MFKCIFHLPIKVDFWNQILYKMGSTQNIRVIFARVWFENHILFNPFSPSTLVKNSWLRHGRPRWYIFGLVLGDFITIIEISLLNLRNIYGFTRILLVHRYFIDVFKTVNLNK